MGNSSFPNQTHQFDDDNMDMDISNTSFINDIWIVKPASQIIIETTIFLPVVLFGLFGNTLSIYVLAKNRHMCTPTNLLIGNMAAADLLSILIHPYVFLTYDFFQNWQLGNFGCKTEGALECSFLLASVITVSAISYDRMTAILLPKEARLTPNGAKIVVVTTWIAGFLISTPLIFYRAYKERQWKDFLEKFCTENTLITNIYWHVIITVLVWLPLTIQLICYICIFVKLNKYEKIALGKLDHHRQINYKKKAVRMMFTIILTFLLCRVPFSVLIFYRDNNLQGSNLAQMDQVRNMATGTYHTIWFTSKFLIYLNAALNPLIYSVTNEKFRKGFETTKLAKWLFPPKQFKVVDSPKPNPKLESAFKKGFFSIFKKKQKLSAFPTNQTIETSVIAKGENPKIVF